MKARRNTTLIATAAVVAMLTAACGSNSGGASSGTDKDAATYDSVLAAVNGLTGQERTDKLVDLAKAAGNKVTVYSTNNLIKDIGAAFTKQYGIKVATFEPDADELVTRVDQEESAHKAIADVADTDGPQLQELANSDLLVPYKTINAPTLIPQALTDGNLWTGDRVNVFAMVRNTDNVSAAEAPKTWEDLTDPKWKGKVILQPGDVDWFWGLYHYWTDTLGWSEDKTMDEFKAMAANGVWIDGHTDGRTQMESGEYDLGLDYRHGAQGAIEQDHAPLAWQPATDPLFARMNGAGLVKNSPNPAGAILMLDFLTGKAVQNMIKDDAQDAAEADLTDIDDQPVQWIDINKFLADSQKFTDLYDSLQHSH